MKEDLKPSPMEAGLCAWESYSSDFIMIGYFMLEIWPKKNQILQSMAGFCSFLVNQMSCLCQISLYKHIYFISKLIWRWVNTASLMHTDPSVDEFAVWWLEKMRLITGEGEHRLVVCWWVSHTGGLCSQIAANLWHTCRDHNIALEPPTTSHSVFQARE